MSDPGPHFSSPHEALDALTSWGEASRLLAAKRDGLLAAGLAAMTDYGNVSNAATAMGLTRQTVYRIKDSKPATLTKSQADAVDWDEYADYLDQAADDIRESLARIARPAGAERPYTADDQRAELLTQLAQAIRDTDITDVGYWALTVELRERAANWARPAIVLESDAREGSTALRSAGARDITEVADQITRFRVEGQEAVSHLDPETLARARTRAPESWAGHGHPDGADREEGGA